jgi:hypothetical protein
MNVLVFLAGHLSTGAEVDMQLEVAGSSIAARALFQFSLGGSLKDMWTAGARQLAVLIGLFSGVWPYAKLFAMAYCWCARGGGGRGGLGARRRGAVLIGLDVMGKWSLIDVYVLVMTMMAFRLQISSPSYRIFPPGFYLVNLQVTPVFGLYAFLMALVSSLVVNNVVLHFHRKAVHHDHPSGPSNQTEDSNPTASRASKGTILHNVVGWNQSEESAACEVGAGGVEAVKSHVFAVAGETALASERYLRPTTRARAAVNLLLAGALALLMLAATLQSYAFEVDGLAGLLMKAGGSVHSSFSLLDTAGYIASQAGLGSNSLPGVLLIALLYLLFAFIMPVVQLLWYLVVWNCTLTVRQLGKANVVAEVLAAWSAAEVFFLAVVVALLEIGQVSKFMVDDACAPLEDVMRHLLVPYGLMRRQDAQCFYVSAEIYRGCFVVMAACALSTLACQLVRRLSVAASQDNSRRTQGYVVDDGTVAVAYPRLLRTLLVNSALRLHLLEELPGPCASSGGGLDSDEVRNAVIKRVAAAGQAGVYLCQSVCAAAQRGVGWAARQAQEYRQRAGSRVFNRGDDERRVFNRGNEWMELEDAGTDRMAGSVESEGGDRFMTEADGGYIFQPCSTCSDAFSAHALSTCCENEKQNKSFGYVL